MGVINLHGELMDSVGNFIKVLTLILSSRDILASIEICRGSILRSYPPDLQDFHHDLELHLAQQECDQFPLKTRDLPTELLLHLE